MQLHNVLVHRRVFPGQLDSDQKYQGGCPIGQVAPAGSGSLLQFASIAAVLVAYLTVVWHTRLGQCDNINLDAQQGWGGRGCPLRGYGGANLYILVFRQAKEYIYFHNQKEKWYNGKRKDMLLIARKNQWTKTKHHLSLSPLLAPQGALVVITV